MVLEGIAAAMWAAFVLLSCASAVILGGGSSGRSSDFQPLSSPHFLFTGPTQPRNLLIMLRGADVAIDGSAIRISRGRWTDCEHLQLSCGFSDYRKSCSLK
jgi:hypothetical protein